jgi:hypothetical protein
MVGFWSGGPLFFTNGLFSGDTGNNTMTVRGPYVGNIDLGSGDDELALNLDSGSLSHGGVGNANSALNNG